MGYFDKMKSLLVSQTKRLVYRQIPDGNVWPSVPTTHFDADNTDNRYIRIWLNEMYLAHSRVLYQTRSPLVHATCRINYGGEAQDFPFVAGPIQRGDLRIGLDRIVSVNYSLLGPVPYRGGDLELLITLSAMVLNDYGDQLLNVLGTLSELVGGSEIKAALPLMKPLKSGVEGLLGMEHLKMHLGVHDTLTPGVASHHRLSTGYRAVIDRVDSEIEPRMLWVRDGRLCEGASLESARPFNSADYLLFSIESVDRRGDDLPSVTQAWDATIRLAAVGSDEEVDLVFASFRMLVLTSPDLIWEEKQFRIRFLADRISMIRAQMGRRGFMSFDTSLAGALKEEQLAAHSGSEWRDLSREQLIRLDWR
jgi:hypothetical protein